MTININALSSEQIAELFQHFQLLDTIRLSGADVLAYGLLTHPDMTNAMRSLIKTHVSDTNGVTTSSAEEVERIISGRPSQTN